MRELTYLGKRALEWREVPEPVPRSEREALVRPFVAARCDGDKLPLFLAATRALRWGVAARHIDPTVLEVLGRHPYRGPFAFGHECVAQVVRCGGEVRDVSVGDVVIVPWAISCGQCFRCRHGLTSKCQDAGDTPISAYGFGPAMGRWGGAVSDLLRVPYADAMLVKVPAGVSPLAVASAGDNLTDAWRLVGLGLRRYPGAPVLVVGGAARSIGLYAAGIAVALGAERVDYLDRNVARREIAESLGANPVVADRRRLDRPTSRADGYLVTADASATLPGLRFALRSLAPGGVCTGVGYYFTRRASLPLTQMYANGSTLHLGVAHARAHLPDLLELLGAGDPAAEGRPIKAGDPAAEGRPIKAGDPAAEGRPIKAGGPAAEGRPIGAGRFRPERVTTLLADWDDAPTAFLADTTKVVVHRPPLPPDALAM